MEIVTTKVLPFLSVILTFGLAIFVHELGHFLMARIRGVGVEAFAIGMGPKIVAWTRGGTEYSLRWFPVGGFVKLHQMIREEAEEDAEREKAAEQEVATEGKKSLGESAHADMEALYDKGLVTKLMVFMGGVTFNVLAAILAVGTLYSMGFTEPIPGPAWVGPVEPDSEVAAAGLRQNDVIRSVLGTPISNSSEAMAAFAKAIEDRTATEGLAVEVEREGAAIELSLPPLTEETLEGYLVPWAWEAHPYIGGLIPFRPAVKAGLREGDLVTAINGEPVETWSELSRIIRASLGDALMFEVRSKGESETRSMVIEPEEDMSEAGRGTGIIGIIPGSGKELLVKETIPVAFVRAPGRALSTLKNLVYFNYQFIKQASFSEIKQGMGGPLAIMGVTYQEAQRGLTRSLRWFMNLNLILAFMNMLPIPILDGGFVVLSVIEAATRRPVSPRILGPVYTFFALCFISLLVLISYNDVLNIFF